GIYTVDDLLNFYPRDYQSFKPPIKLSEAEEGVTVTVELGIVDSFKWKKTRTMTIGTGQASDGTNRVSIVYFNMPYLKGKLIKGSRFLFHGKVRSEDGKYYMDQPKLFTYDEYNQLMGQLWPCYPLTRGLSNNAVMKAADRALEDYEEAEYLPEDIIKEYGLIPLKEAKRLIHFPKDWEALIEARKRLVFDEFFQFLISIRKMKEYNKELDTDYAMIETAWPRRLIEQLPYKLTGAQSRVWNEIRQDLTSGKCMNRLVQGDVGSGKTILAFLSLLMTVTNGYQGALMAPTEILATQHFEQLVSMIKKYNLPFCPVLLTGSLRAGAKRDVYQQIESGEVNVVIGTHALIQEKVRYAKLGLVITDEQHRFGVRQREILNEKGGRTHVLVM
ncbi:MAG: DEAD/DEAH box helicase, partial [Lachnospiraceae bacterium]|nr:DEAD/DEAH box helicase [Lachnospiraceae bacterium]